ncbi:MAG: helix-turn-helix transcriptional regulator [Acidimicrobiaceae bacterium]|nr:helix-turn-helix transcriptional regulator [Acidimicrobiaceae bacterium]
MEELNSRDFELVLSAVQAVSAAQDPVTFSQLAIEQVARLVPCDVVTFNEMDPLIGEMTYRSVPWDYHVPPEVQQNLEVLARQHPMIRYYSESGDGSAKKFSDFWSQEQFHDSQLYELVYQPLNVEYQMSIVLPTLHPNVVGIAASRSHDDFSERDRTILNTLRPYFVQAWYSARDRERLLSHLNSTIGALADAELGLIVLSDPPQELTDGALAALCRHFGPPTSTSPWPVLVEQWLVTQRSWLSNPDGLRLLAPLRVESEGRQMVLRYLPEQVASHGTLLLREEPIRPRQQSLQSLGLSAREAEVTTRVISGSTNASIAATMFISSATVKKHLENVYAKLGVRGRGELTAFVHDVLDRPLH